MNKKYDFINEEIKRIDSNFDKTIFNDRSVLITGATGLLGSTLVRYFSLIKNEGITVKIFAFARNKEKAESMFFPDNINWLFDISDGCYDVDYVIHTAGPTDSVFFTNNPVETINDSIKLFKELIEHTKNSLKSFVFLSSMEVYGNSLEDRLIKEDEFYGLNPNLSRSSYPEVKRLLECLSISLFKEYSFPIKIVRLCQTFGPGVAIDDNRVFAQFARAVVNKTNIVLSTKGETKRSYSSVLDSVLGILFVLINGKNGEAYNLSSRDSYCSIYDLANMFVNDTGLKVEVEETNNPHYLGTIKFGLDISKAESLGFHPVTTLKQNIHLFIDYYKALCEEEITGD